MELSEKIKYLRKKENLSQNELAKKLLVERQTISRWENNMTRPDAYNLELLSDLFNVSMDWLLRETQNIDDLVERDFLAKTEIHTSQSEQVLTKENMEINIISKLIYQVEIHRVLTRILLVLITIHGLIHPVSVLLTFPLSFAILYVDKPVFVKRIFRLLFLFG